MDEEYIIPGSNELIDHSPSDTETVVPGSNQLFDGDGSPGPVFANHESREILYFIRKSLRKKRRKPSSDLDFKGGIITQS